MSQRRTDESCSFSDNHDNSGIRTAGLQRRLHQLRDADAAVFIVCFKAEQGGEAALGGQAEHEVALWYERALTEHEIRAAGAVRWLKRGHAFDCEQFTAA